MHILFKAAAFAGLIGAAAIAAAPAEAHNDHFRFGHARIGIYFGDGYAPYDNDGYRDGYFRVHERCTPERALYKARLVGVHAARIDYVSQRRIGVSGRSRGELVSLTFARAPSCPIVG
jgi:hypothetical protein